MPYASATYWMGNVSLVSWTKKPLGGDSTHVDDCRVNDVVCYTIWHEGDQGRKPVDGGARRPAQPQHGHDIDRPHGAHDREPEIFGFLCGVFCAEARGETLIPKKDQGPKDSAEAHCTCQSVWKRLRERGRC
jgi:hypothetical protein